VQGETVPTAARGDPAAASPLALSEEPSSHGSSAGLDEHRPGALVLPRNGDTRALLDLAEDAEEAARWGLRERPELDFVLLDPGTFTERTIRMAARNISGAFKRVDLARLAPEDATPFETLQTGNPPPSIVRPPSSCRDSAIQDSGSIA
jgi:hypothetical protein